MLVGVTYAASDEFHQSFVPGRGPSIIDVGIDSLGVLTGILIVLIIISIYRALKSDKRCNEYRTSSAFNTINTIKLYLKEK